MAAAAAMTHAAPAAIPPPVAAEPMAASPEEIPAALRPGTPRALTARLQGEPRPIDDQTARRTYAEVGSPLAGWFSAQPLFDWIIAEQADCQEDA